jgi:hypothetical protein
MTPQTDAPTDPLFIAVASILAAIESGTIAEGEAIASEIREGRESTITILLRRDVRPILLGDET